MKIHQLTFEKDNIMSKRLIAILLAVTVIIGCNKEPNKPEDDLTNSIDGWEITKSNYDFDINPRDIFFINPNIGFVVGYNGDIYKTIDSGQTWVKKNSGTTLHLFSVFFLNEDVGFVSSQASSGCLDADCDKGSVLLKTTDGGETWTKTFFPDYTRILSLKFFDALKGIAIIYIPEYPNSRDNEYVAITSDGGINWNLPDLAIIPYCDKLFSVDNSVFVAGENQKIFKSSDYGYNWQTISTPIEAYNSVGDIYFYNEQIGFIDGITSVYKTTNGGLNWIKTNFPFTNFGTIHFYDENEGFNIEPVMVYEEGGDFPIFKGSICYETRNGGESWSTSNLVKSLYLGFTFFPQRNLGYGFNLSEFYTIKKKE
jgi:photosystem II stability/assembly factor-like uncharacterized protein